MRLFIALALTFVALGPAEAQVQKVAASSAFTYQGQLIDNDVPSNLNADLLFTLYDAAVGGTKIGTTVDHSNVPVVNGIFTVDLDFGMSAFDGNARWLQIQVRSPAGSGSYTTMTPRQELTAVPYALRALSGSGGGGQWDLVGSAITNSNAPGFVGVNRTSPVTTAEYFGVQAPVGDNAYGGMYIGTDSATGKPFYGYSTGPAVAWTYLSGADSSWRLYNGGDRLTVLNNGNVGVGTTLPSNKLSVVGIVESTTGGFRFPDGSVQTSAATGGGGGNDGDWTINGNDMVMTPSGKISIGTATPAPNAKLTVVDNSVFGQTIVDVSGTLLGKIELNGGEADLDLSAVFDEAQIASGSGQDLSLISGRKLFVTAAQDMQFRTSGARWAQINSAGVTEFFHSNNNATVTIDGQDPDHSGGQIELFKSNGTRTAQILGAGGSGSQGAQILLYNDTNSATATAVLDGEYGGEAGGALVLRNNSGQKGVEMLGDTGPGDKAIFWMYKPDGTRTFEITSHESGNAAEGSALEMYSAAGVRTIRLDAVEGNLADQGGSIKLYDDQGNETIELDGDYGTAGEGRIITQVLEITGGADLSEQFDVLSDGGSIEPGSVVSIDPSSPGDLRISKNAYDRRVAGIISGAGGVRPGMLMGQRGTEADGQLPVALTGRVYCKVDASYGAIEPGDLLTTSDTPGYAMKVTDHTQAMGAILGKAMTGLTSGRGEVLVLVSLQ